MPGGWPEQWTESDSIDIVLIAIDVLIIVLNVYQCVVAEKKQLVLMNVATRDRSVALLSGFWLMFDL
jgi:hypothetical protein